MYVFACIDKEHLWKNIQGTSTTHHLCAGTCHWGTKVMGFSPQVPLYLLISKYVTILPDDFRTCDPITGRLYADNMIFFLHGFVDLFLAALGRRCRVWAFSSCGRDRLLFSCGGFSCCRAWAQERRLSRRGALAQVLQGTQGSSRTRN